MDFVRRWSEKTEIGAGRLDITGSKFYDWRERYGKVNEHNGWVPRDFWLEGFPVSAHHKLGPCPLCSYLKHDLAWSMFCGAMFEGFACASERQHFGYHRL